MATTVWNPLASAQQMRLITIQKNTGLGSDMPVQFAIANALMSAINAGGNISSTTVSMSGFSAQDIQYWMGVLNGLGYTTIYSGTTLTIGWNV
jgi:hypothetical protein